LATRETHQMFWFSFFRVVQAVVALILIVIECYA
jgi:hypothetical protein